MKGRWTAAIVLGAAAVLLGGTPAYAHNAFSTSTPKDKAVLHRVPAEVALKFIAKLSPTGTKVTLTDPAGQPAAGGPARFDGPTVMVPLVATTAGIYTASYEVASADGHPIRGKITFTLTEQALPPPPPPTTTAPEPSLTNAGSSAPPNVPVARENPDDAGGAPWWPWLAAGVALVVMAGAGLVRARRRRG